MTDAGPNENDVRNIAKLELSTVQDARNRLVDEHAASFRWLIASLFAANGGALIALASSEGVPAYAKVWAGGWFTLGVLLSLLTAWLNQRLTRRMIDPISKLIAFWGCVAHGMQFDEAEHRKLVAAVQESMVRTWPTQVAGWAAAAVFLFGMVAAGTGYWSHEENRLARPAPLADSR